MQDKAKKREQDMKKKRDQEIKKNRAEQIGKGKNAAIVNRGRAINDGKNMKRKTEEKKRGYLK